MLEVRKTKEPLSDFTDHKIEYAEIDTYLIFIGEISKVLFGTTNNEDAKYYNEQIKHFEENIYDFTKLLRQHLLVVKSSLGAINNAIMDMKYNKEKVKKERTATSQEVPRISYLRELREMK